PTGFIPSQDMGSLLCNVQLPDSAAQERTIRLMDKLETIAHETEGVKHTQAMTGQSMLLSANGSNFGSMFVILDAYHERPDPVLGRFFTWYNDTLKYLDEDVDTLFYNLDRRSTGGVGLQLITPADGVDGIPKTGRNLVVIAGLGDVLHLRVFDGDGRIVLDADETRLVAQAGPIAALKAQLENLWPPHQ